jgi:hypothetical protein
LIFTIDKHIYGFDPREAYAVVLFYEKRVKDILENLEPVQYWLDNDGISDYKVAMKEKWQQDLMQDYTTELNTYLAHFQTYKRILSERVSAMEEQGGRMQISKTEAAARPVIQLLENFTVKQLNKLFDPQLSLNQAALFLYYLREQAILPPYTDTALGKLAEAFFVRNQKNISESITDIYTVKRSKDHLNTLKRVLQSLLKEIDNDLKEAR